MKKQTNIQLQIIMAISMFLVSIFMAISYYIEILNNVADYLTTIAFFVWIFSIFAWFIKIIHDINRLKQMRNEPTGRQKD